MKGGPYCHVMWLFVKVSKVVLISKFLWRRREMKWSEIGVAFWMLWFSLEACFSAFGLKRSESYKGRILFLAVLGHSCVRRPSMEVIFLNGLTWHMKPNGGKLKCGVQQIFRSGLWTLQWLVVGLCCVVTHSVLGLNQKDVFYSFANF